MRTKRKLLFPSATLFPVLVTATACSSEAPLGTSQMGTSQLGTSPDELSGTLDDAAITHEFAALGAALTAKSKSPPDHEFAATLLGRYATGITDSASSGETAAVDGDRLFVTSAEAVVLDVVNIANPQTPTLITRLDLSPYGASVQSVAVSSRSLVAVAVGGVAKTDPGTIVLLNRDGLVLRTVSVGALPDMVTFTPNGKKLVVANEGEPDCYGAGCTDPLGSISILSVHPLRAVVPVTTLDFSNVTLPSGVRVFGPGATAAQDLEPEYVAISKDSKKAYVTLQENNAIALVDLDRAKIVEVRALGYKDFAAPPTSQTFELLDLPPIGTTAAGQALKLGGFSGLFYEGQTAAGTLRFVTHTDRGPNGEPVAGKRPFLLPDFTPRVVRLELDPKSGAALIKEQILLKDSAGAPLTGLPNTTVSGGSDTTAHNDEVPVDLFGNTLGLDPQGGDFEGIVVLDDGSFWLTDEYRPALYHFDAQGVLIARLVPVGAHAAVGLVVPEPGVAGDLGIEALPAVLGQRRQNRGFEGIALQNGLLYAVIQSPLRNPQSATNSTLNGLKNVRLVEVDPTTFATRQFLYVMDNTASGGGADTRADKIGDVTASPGGGFLLVERDDDALPEDPAGTINKKVYAFNLTGATDITTKDTLYAGKTLDEMSTSELSAAGVKPVTKVLHVDLVAAGYANLEKVEGLAWIDSSTLALINDNDFGVGGIVVDQSNGTFTYSDTYVPEPEVIGLVTRRGIDASDRDNVINIRNWPVYGMYQPDAIATFTARGTEYLITANEGDARDYEGFAEEARARSLSASYSDVPEVASDAELGRLTVTTAPPDGDYSRPYVFGTRSFSIWNAKTGAQLWDSGAELEHHTADAFPFYFNSSNDATAFDNRSDNKGPEPEGVATGELDGRPYAFVALERMGGIMVYDISKPTAPTFVTYLTSRDYSASAVGPDSGPEVVKFVTADKSPTGEPLLMVAHEITGTVTLWALSDGKCHEHD
jgi:hypothetical protein